MSENAKSIMTPDEIDRIKWYWRAVNMVTGYYKKTINYDREDVVMVFRIDKNFVAYLYSRAENK